MGERRLGDAVHIVQRADLAWVDAPLAVVAQAARASRRRNQAVLVVDDRPGPLTAWIPAARAATTTRPSTWCRPRGSPAPGADGRAGIQRRRQVAGPTSRAWTRGALAMAWRAAPARSRSAPPARCRPRQPQLRLKGHQQVVGEVDVAQFVDLRRHAHHLDGAPPPASTTATRSAGRRAACPPRSPDRHGRAPGASPGGGGHGLARRRLRVPGDGSSGRGYLVAPRPGYLGQHPPARPGRRGSCATRDRSAPPTLAALAQHPEDLADDLAWTCLPIPTEDVAHLVGGMSSRSALLAGAPPARRRGGLAGSGTGGGGASAGDRRGLDAAASISAALSRSSRSGVLGRSGEPHRSRRLLRRQRGASATPREQPVWRRRASTRRAGQRGHAASPIPRTRGSRPALSRRPGREHLSTAAA